MKWLAILVLLGVGFAGCAGDDGPEKETGTDNGTPEPEILTGIPDVDAGETLAMLKNFAETYSVRKGNHADHVGARDWLADEFTAANLTLWRQPFTNGIAQENICGIKWGHDTANWVIVGGHYDTTTTGNSHDEQSQGAYDDGSGTMMTIALAHAFADYTTNYTIAFCAFDGEERGLQGSRAVYNALWVDRTEWNNTFDNFAGMLNLDMFGLNWPAIDAPIYFDSNNPDLTAAVQARATEVGLPEDKIEYTGITLGQSDYAHWYDTPTPTGFYISNFEKWQAPGGSPPVVGGVVIPQGAYPFWHVADTWETMVLMAGSEDALEGGFQMALDLATGTLSYLADQPLGDDGESSAVEM